MKNGYKLVLKAIKFFLKYKISVKFRSKNISEILCYKYDIKSKSNVF